jgi:hypothetical protein
MLAMAEFFKVMSVLVVAGGVVACALSWFGFDRPDQTTWIFRIASPAAVLAALALFLYLTFRRDLAPDFLSERCGGNYCDRHGFCFTAVADQKNGIANLVVHFQSQYDRPCKVRIALRPARGFWLTRAQMDCLTLDIECPPAGFGEAVKPIAIPLDLQGSTQSFEIGASVHYPQGKGKQLRFGEGVVVRANAEFENPIGQGLFLAGAAAGAIALPHSATMKIALPDCVAPELKESPPTEVVVLWQLGHPMPKTAH